MSFVNLSFDGVHTVVRHLQSSALGVRHTHWILLSHNLMHSKIVFSYDPSGKVPHSTTIRIAEILLIRSKLSVLIFYH